MTLQPVNGMNGNTQSSAREVSTNNIDTHSDNNTIWAKFSDKDNIIDSTDVYYTQDGTISEEINKFLEANKGKNWTTALKNEFNQIIQRFNLECEGDDLFNDVDSLLDDKNNVSSQEKKIKTSTGKTFAIYNNDNTTLQIDLNEHTITKYDSNGKILSRREMTAEERTLPTNNLIELLQNNSGSSEISNETTNQNYENNIIKGKGINGTYNFIETGNGYQLKTNVSVSLANNQAAKAFLRGLTNNFGISSITPDKDGYYNYRGIKAGTYNTLYAVARVKAQDIATQTAIYNDIQNKSKNGKELSASEQKFIQDFYLNLLKV